MRGLFFAVLSLHHTNAYIPCTYIDIRSRQCTLRFRKRSKNRPSYDRHPIYFFFVAIVCRRAVGKYRGDDKCATCRWRRLSIRKRWPLLHDKVQTWHFPSQYTRIARSSTCNPHVDRPCPPSMTVSRDLSLTQRHYREMSWTLECAVTPTIAERKVGQTRMRWQAGGTRGQCHLERSSAVCLSVCLAKRKPCGASGHVCSSRCQNKQSGHTTGVW